MRLDERTRHNVDDVGDCHEYGNPYCRRNHIRQTLQLTQYAVVAERYLRRQVAVVVNMVDAVLAEGNGTCPFRLRVVVESDGYQQRQVYQQQQPCKFHSPYVRLVHYPHLFTHAKIVQTECRTTSLLDCYAEVQPILCKGNAKSLSCIVYCYANNKLLD